MSDFIYIVIVSTALWLSQVATSYETEVKAEIEDLRKTTSLLWVEGALASEQYKECKAQIRRKR